MKYPGTHSGHKEQARQRAERRTRSHQTPVTRTPPAPPELTVCRSCASVFGAKTWRRSPLRTARALATESVWGTCPACSQAAKGEAAGRVLLSVDSAGHLEEELRRRIAHVCQRAAFTQPERRLIGIIRNGEVLEVRTTSQELAHRIAREVEKAFGGRAVYSWCDDDGHLLARWEPRAARPGTAD